MIDQVVVVPYDPQWPACFHQLGLALRAALGATALRIDHIGSTSIPDLAAKPVIDIQISVASFDPLDAFKQPLEPLGYVFRGNNTDRRRGYSSRKGLGLSGRPAAKSAASRVFNRIKYKFQSICPLNR